MGVFLKNITPYKSNETCSTSMLPLSSRHVIRGKAEIREFPRGGTPHIWYTGMCGLYAWFFLGKKYVEMGICS